MGNCKCYVCGELILPSETLYTYDDNDGREQTYHMLCFTEQTTQGVQGYKPSKIYRPASDDPQLF